MAERFEDKLRSRGWRTVNFEPVGRTKDVRVSIEEADALADALEAARELWRCADYRGSVVGARAAATFREALARLDGAA